MRGYQPAASSPSSSSSRRMYGSSGQFVSPGFHHQHSPYAQSNNGGNGHFDYQYYRPSPSSHGNMYETGYTSTTPPQIAYTPPMHYGRNSGDPMAISATSSGGTAPLPSRQLPSTSSNAVAAEVSYSRQQEQQQQKVKRAKSAQKITRNRKITSCLQCRERKQKCDRQRPICSNCLSGNSRGGMCTYVDTPEAVQEVLANEEERYAKRVKPSPDGDDDDEQIVSPVGMPVGLATMSSSQANVRQGHARRSSSSRPMLPSQSPLTVRRINLIAATERAGKDKSLDFEVRVRYARAAAMGSILFGTPPPHHNAVHQLYHPLAAVDSLKLPTANEMGAFLDTYRRYVEWMCNVVIVDLNRARFESFLNWWHSNPQTLPADPPLVPLVLTVLALALQAKRMAPHCSLAISKKRTIGKTDSANSAGRDRGQSPRDPFLASISSEKELLETAQRCIDALQIVCPSNSASAFSAPLDLVRASLLRGIWHITELHLQFAGSCFATTVRLAHAASLHHDTRHWPTMGKEEAQARRNIFWNVAMFESSFALRVTQPTIMLPVSTSDTHFPEDYDALMNLYRYGGLIEPYITEGRRSHFRVRPVTKASFDFHLARFQLTSLLMSCQEMLRTGKQEVLADRLQSWRENLSDAVRHYLNDDDDFTYPDVRARDDIDAETHYLQRSMLRMMHLSTTIQIHRPQADENGRWRAFEGQAQQSLEVCINSAQTLIRLIHSILSRNPGPPFVLFHQCIFQCFQAAIVIAIQSALSAGSNSSYSSPSFATKAQPSLLMALEILDSVAEKDVLRNIAEQAGRYAATLRDIDASQQARLVGRGTGASRQSAVQSREATVEADLSASQNVHRSGVGVPAVIMAEGDGKILGGQGYPLDPSRTPSSSIKGAESPARTGLWSGSTPGVGFMGGDGSGAEFSNRLPSIQTGLPNYSFGIDFSDLQVFGQTDPSQAQKLGLAALDGTFNDRTVPVPEGPYSTGGSGLDPHLGDLPTGQTADANAATTQMASWPTAAEIPAQGAATPFGDTFAMDWNEWERAVERLLHTER